MAYTPPSPLNVILPSGYTPPTGLAVNFTLSDTAGSAQTAYPASIGPTSFGTQLVAYRIRTVTIEDGAYVAPYALAVNSVLTAYTPPSGGAVNFYFGSTITGRFGQTLVYNSTTPAFLTGIPPSGVGTPSLVNTAFGIFPGGIAPQPQSGAPALQEAPPPFVAYRDRVITPVGIAPPTSQFGAPYVAFYYQFIDTAGLGSGPETFGAPFVAYKVRYVFPDFIVSAEYGTPLVGRNITVYPSGFGGETFPTTHSVEDFSNKIRTHSGSADQASYGIAYVRHDKLFIYPSFVGWPSSTVNFPAAVYNKTQVLTVRQYEDTDADPAKYGQLTIINRNRTLTTFGHQDSRFSYYAADVSNAARSIAPAGLDATLWGNNLVAYRIRNVYPQGWDSFYIQVAGGSVVYNAARVVAPTSIAAGSVGTGGTVLNRNRTVAQFFPSGPETFGTAFVAYRIRTVSQLPFNDVPAGLPEVRFNPYPIRPTGIDSYRTGGQFVYSHINQILPYAINVGPQDRIGEASVVNRNKTVAPYGYEQSSFGLARIENFIRHVLPSSITQLVFGATDISRRTKEVAPQPFSSHLVSAFLQVRNVIPDPPGQQNIFVSGFSSAAVPAPVFNRQTVFPASITPGVSGSPTVRANAIRPVWVFDDYVGTPTLVATQYVYPRQVPHPAPDGYGESDVFTAVPRLSPHTIYAPGSDQATPQAVLNHGGVNGSIIDADMWYVHPYHFGEATVSNRNRTVSAVGSGPFTLYGTPRVELKDRRIYPVGSRFVRFGTASLNGAQEVRVNGFVSSVVNTSLSVAHPYVAPDPTIYGQGWVSSYVAAPDIANFHRQVYPSGHEQTVFGDALIGYPRRIYPEGYVATQWGAADVSYRNRFVHPVGFNAFLSSDRLSGFNDRMRVRNRTPSPPFPTYPP